jgi:D-aspartate ligase
MPPRDAVTRGTAWLESPALLFNSDFYGTLAATRALGQAGVPVIVAGCERLGISSWSRYATRTILCPELHDSSRFLDWLCEFGEREPGIVLYPTSDDTSYLFALRAEQLSRTFRTYQPPLDAILAVLDKKRLYETARRVGLNVPETWFPESDADVERVAREAKLPVLVKPRTQILSRDHSKGLLIAERSELLPRYREFVRDGRYGRALLDTFPDAGRAMIQEFLPAAAEQIYVLAAFVDRSGTLFAARSGMKILQKPRRLGIGVCFEAAPLDPALADAARRLAVESGYFGLFQLEFISVGGRYLLIDFNPRYYNQLAFDVARGLPLPTIVQAAACDRPDIVTRLLRGVAPQPQESEIVFCNAFGLNLIVSAQLLSGAMSAEEARFWRQWRQRYAASVIDPAVLEGDVMPQIIDIVSQLFGVARHPRSFWRTIVMNRPPTHVTARQQGALDRSSSENVVEDC